MSVLYHVIFIAVFINNIVKTNICDMRQPYNNTSIFIRLLSNSEGSKLTIQCETQKDYTYLT